MDMTLAAVVEAPPTSVTVAVVVVVDLILVVVEAGEMVRTLTLEPPRKIFLIMPCAPKFTLSAVF